MNRQHTTYTLKCIAHSQNPYVVSVFANALRQTFKRRFYTYPTLTVDSNQNVYGAKAGHTSWMGDWIEFNRECRELVVVHTEGHGAS